MRLATLNYGPRSAETMRSAARLFWMRQAQKRTVEDTWRHIGHLVEKIEPGECGNYFANAGYASVKT